jgi:triphosphoribosyl-dephospho-CoA synthase
VVSSLPLHPDVVAAAGQIACLIEVSASKPGNVSPARHFRDVRYEHFLASAAAIGPALMRAGERPIGPTVLAAVEDTARWSSSNTNLGIILLFAPLARAALIGRPGALRDSVAGVLAATTVADARAVYAAIRLARPGGLGRVEDQDVGQEPTATLREVMALAAERDAIAAEYASAFETTFVLGVPAIRSARRSGLSWDDATVETYLTLLAAHPDSLIARKQGAGVARDVAQQAAAVLAAGGVRSTAGRNEIEALDLALRDPHNAMNPGTTADLTAAALFVALLEGEWTDGQGGPERRPLTADRQPA